MYMWLVIAGCLYVGSIVAFIFREKSRNRRIQADHDAESKGIFDSLVCRQFYVLNGPKAEMRLLTDDPGNFRITVERSSERHQHSNVAGTDHRMVIARTEIQTFMFENFRLVAVRKSIFEQPTPKLPEGVQWADQNHPPNLAKELTTSNTTNVGLWSRSQYLRMLSQILQQNLEYAQPTVESGGEIEAVESQEASDEASQASVPAQKEPEPVE